MQRDLRRKFTQASVQRGLRVELEQLGIQRMGKDVLLAEDVLDALTGKYHCFPFPADFGFEFFDFGALKLICMWVKLRRHLGGTMFLTLEEAFDIIWLEIRSMEKLNVNDEVLGSQSACFYT